MVEFTNRKGPTPIEDVQPWPVEIRPEAGEIDLPIRPEQVANSIACFIYDTKKIQPNLTHLQITVEETTGTVSESMRLIMNNTKEDTKKNIGIVNIRSQPFGSTAVITVDGEALQESFSDSLITRDYMEPDNITNNILNFLSETKEKVRLGYGPMHTFDDIDPINSQKSLTRLPIDRILPIYKEWLSTIHTKTEETTNEHGFLVDSKGNTIGVLEGNNHSVPMPILDSNEGQLSVHTHPRIRSSAVPSKNDMIHFTKYLKVGAKGVILHSGGSIYYESDYNKEDDEEKPQPLYDRHFMLSVEKQRVDKDLDIETIINRNKENLEELHEATYNAMLQGLNDQRGTIPEGYISILQDNIEEHKDNAEEAMKKDSSHFEHIREQYRVNNIVFTYNPIAIPR